MINKFLSVVLILFVVLVFYGALKQIEKIDPKIKRLECQNQTITFERINIQNPASQAITSFKNSNYELNTTIDYSTHMKSHLVNILNKEDANKLFDEVAKKFITQNKAQDEKVSINYYIYENDKKDPSKKGKKSKLYAGYVKFEFNYEDKIVYQIQTDYESIDAKDLDQRIDCALQSFTSIN